MNIGWLCWLFIIKNWICIKILVSRSTIESQDRPKWPFIAIDCNFLLKCYKICGSLVLKITKNRSFFAEHNVRLNIKIHSWNKLNTSRIWIEFDYFCFGQSRRKSPEKISYSICVGMEKICWKTRFFQRQKEIGLTSSNPPSSYRYWYMKFKTKLHENSDLSASITHKMSVNKPSIFHSQSQINPFFGCSNVYSIFS